jgi:hypothetical protein
MNDLSYMNDSSYRGERQRSYQYGNSMLCHNNIIDHAIKLGAIIYFYSKKTTFYSSYCQFALASYILPAKAAGMLLERNIHNNVGLSLTE